MNNLMHLTPIQQNILIASIIGDGEITKIYPNSRRKNHSYREHFGLEQQAYREWKASFFDGLLYISEKSSCVRSVSLPLFTTLYPHFYDEQGIKHIPIHLLRYCTLPYFLAVLYMDDGSLCISTTVNARKKLIYLTPHIYLYLQCYPPGELEQLQNHILKFFNVIFRLSKRKDGQGMILKTTSVKDTFLFLDLISSITTDCPSMYYKTNWNERLQMEKAK
ncbi:MULTISPECIES: DNA endonuclease [Anoxybacillus]|uniref:DNA endonuclease n=1 Tax=Anoxybacillus TaxID=150247 RepID=UPI000A541136|nr:MULTISPECIES: DNA endonuclease [Anoxybacillus]